MAQQVLMTVYTRIWQLFVNILTISKTCYLKLSKVCYLIFFVRQLALEISLYGK